MRAPIRNLPGRRWALLWIALGLAASGCSSLPGSTAPEVTLVNIRFTDLTVFETSGVITVRLANAANEPLVVDGGTFALSLNGVRVGKALSDQRMEVARLDTGTFDVDIHLSNIALITRLRAIMDQRTVSYRLKSKLYVDRGFGARRTTVSSEGTLDLEELTRPL